MDILQVGDIVRYAFDTSKLEGDGKVVDVRETPDGTRLYTVAFGGTLIEAPAESLAKVTELLPQPEQEAPDGQE